MPNKRRPLVITIVSIILIVIGLVLVAVDFLILALGITPNIPLRPMIDILGYPVGLVQFSAFISSLGVYGMFQGYGLWNLRTWSWWLYIVFTVIRFLPILFFPRLLYPIFVPIDVAWLLFLLYLVRNRYLFDVKFSK